MGSDAHEYQKMFKPAEDRHCWVKSELTFEGLLQVVYEPSERVVFKMNNLILEIFTK